jgi:hypothetical protein
VCHMETDEGNCGGVPWIVPHQNISCLRRHQDIRLARPNRWLLTLREPSEAEVVLLVQARPLLTSTDVHDLAELVRLRRPQRGILLAYAGAFTADARRTATELADERLKLCTALPAAQEYPSEES